MNEDQILEKYSTSGLRKNQLTRQTKKLNMEFDERYNMTKKEREEFLDLYYPEK